MAGKTNSAGKREVLAFYTSLMRMECEHAKLYDAIKAAEFFSKYYGITEKGNQESGGVVIIDDVPCGGDADRRKTP